MTYRRMAAGDIYNRWTVLELLPLVNLPDNKKLNCRAKCRCQCGKEVVVFRSHLVSGASKSCGCHGREVSANRMRQLNYVHGHTVRGNHSKTWNSWSCMLQRCDRPDNIGYVNYGGRGIKVCAEWYDFEKFLQDMGERPAGHTLDRLDVNSNYCKENCRWSTYKEQANNRRKRSTT